MNAIELVLVGALLANSAPAKARTFIGWLSDESCAMARAKDGVFAPTNPDCAKRCIQAGKTVGFISADEKAVFKVRNYHKAIEDLGWRLELTADLDEDSKELTVQSVKRLEQQGAMCGRPVKKSPKP